jgi:PAS domain S-box-containing protein
LIDGTTTYWNHASEIIYGYTSQEAIGKNLLDLIIPPEMRENVQQAIKCAAETGQTIPAGEVVLMRKDGSRVPVYSSHALLKPAGREMELFCMDIDLTQSKQVEESLKQKQQQLETLNQSLETRINNALTEMRQKDDMLIQQGRLAAMGEMINNIAHQWRQPLNNLGLIVQNMKLSSDLGELTPEDVDKNVTNAMDVILHMSRTIDDFRNFFRYEKEPTLFNVNQVVSSALNFVAPALKSSGINVEWDEQPDITAQGFPNEYLQAVLNILNNAKDALLENKITQPLISIRIYSEKMHSVVTIRDNADGIKEDILQKIFDPYFSTKGHGQGTGLGLYMSKAIIEKNMGGRLSARNVEGGAEFRIEV